MKPDYSTLSAAIRARAWVRLFRKKKGREPTVEERVAWIVRHHTSKIDVAYVNRACENLERTT